MATTWGVTAGVVLFLGLTGILTIVLVYKLTPGEIPFDYGIVIDAGSTKSTGFLYKWKGDKDDGTGIVEQEGSCTSIKPGLADSKDSNGVGKLLLNCLMDIWQTIPVEKIPTTPLFLGATAGMRLLNISNPEKSKEIITTVGTILPKSRLDVRSVEIISGENEGLYAWVTTNFLLKTIQERKDHTFGAMDLGGASTQITFEVAAEFSGKQNVHYLKLYGKDYHVYSDSYLCYGLNEVYRRYLAILADKPEKTGTVYDPCAPEGTTFNATEEYIFNEACTTTDDYKKWFDSNPTKAKQIRQFQGTGNIDECKKKVTEVYGYDVCIVKFQECFKPLDQVFKPGKVMAFAGYFYTMAFLNTTSTNETVFLQTLNDYCSLTWDQITKKYQVDEFTAKYCFQGHAIHHMLTAGYGFNKSTWTNVNIVKVVNGVDVGWPLGLMIDATNAIPEKGPTPPSKISLEVFGFVLGICVGFILLAFVFFIVHKRFKNSNL